MADDNVINLMDAAVPSARLKQLDWSDKRARCEHKHVLVWSNEPILECKDCGGIVDPYQWIRGRARDWKSIIDNVEGKKKLIEMEIADLQKALRLLKGEFKDERERQEAKRMLMILPKRY